MQQFTDALLKIRKIFFKSKFKIIVIIRFKIDLWCILNTIVSSSTRHWHSPKKKQEFFSSKVQTVIIFRFKIDLRCILSTIVCLLLKCQTYTTIVIKLRNYFYVSTSDPKAKFSVIFSYIFLNPFTANVSILRIQHIKYFTKPHTSASKSNHDGSTHRLT